MFYNSTASDSLDLLESKLLEILQLISLNVEKYKASEINKILNMHCQWRLKYNN